MKKLTMSVFSLFILILLAHGAFPAEKVIANDAKSKVILPIEQIHEGIPGPDLDDKKTPFIPSTFVLLYLTISYILVGSSVIRHENSLSFLIAVFFQSNYVIKAP
ncbi:hypothetical protein [Mesobacillus jeotgali]|uniref:hypothetical protein n=1 Tax=Mesobacillus jeotgali TaxID=129985 RepID=UPI0009A90742|nr:hypothetical protein [Mesobacillus jeotgali]